MQTISRAWDARDKTRLLGFGRNPLIHQNKYISTPVSKFLVASELQINLGESIEYCRLKKPASIVIIQFLLLYLPFRQRADSDMAVVNRRRMANQKHAL